MAGVFLDYFGTGSPIPGGHYRNVMRSGAIASMTTANTTQGEIASLRWSDASHFFVLLRVDVSAYLSVADTAVTPTDIAATITRGYTTADTGGTAYTGAKISRMRAIGGAAMQPSLIADMRAATTISLVGSTTRTDDANPFAYATFGGIANTAGNNASLELYNVAYGVEHPVVLGPNEGVVFSILTARGGTTAALTYTITVVWAEVPNF